MRLEEGWPLEEPMSRGKFSGWCKLSWLIVLIWCGMNLISCRTVTSVIPGIGDDEGPEAGQRLYLNVTPEEALALLVQLAPEHGWQVASTGDQFDMTGLRGKYFRLETEKFIGGRQEMSGVFFNDPNGTYVIIGKRGTGLPEPLVAPLTAAVEKRTVKPAEL
jgi:hypothetical protein